MVSVMFIDSIYVYLPYDRLIGYRCTKIGCINNKRRAKELQAYFFHQLVSELFIYLIAASL